MTKGGTEKDFLGEIDVESSIKGGLLDAVSGIHFGEQRVDCYGFPISQDQAQNNIFQSVRDLHLALHIAKEHNVSTGPEIEEARNLHDKYIEETKRYFDKSGQEFGYKLRWLEI